MLRIALLFVVVLSALLASFASAQTNLYTGSWTNTTFGSTGGASAILTSTPPSFTFTLDLDGNVFGGSNPTPLTLVGTMNPDGSISFNPVIGHPTYGDVTGSVSPTRAITAMAINVPGPQVESVALNGQFIPGAIDINYSVNFEAAGVPPAQGFIDLNLVPEPASAGLLVLGCLAMLRRRQP